MKNVIKTLGKCVFFPLWLSAAASTPINKKILGSDHRPPSSTSHNNNNIKLIMSND